MIKFLKNIFKQKSYHEQVQNFILSCKKDGITTENYPNIKLDSAKMPEGFQDLTKIAEYWGQSDDALRGYIIYKASVDDLKEFVKIISSRNSDINQWISENSIDTDEEVALATLGITLIETEKHLEIILNESI